jgi:Winged helix DNA-binding domain
MASATMGPQRLARQRLTANHLATPAEVVSWFGAAQSQEYLGAIWSLGMRMVNATDVDIERAFAEGTILRTHVMRPTWHFVAPADIRWLLELTAPRVRALLAHYDRQLGVDEALRARSNAVFSAALVGGRHRLRGELGKALAEEGIAAEGQRLGHLIMHAELDGVLCSGPRRGKQFTYALLAERAPKARTLSRDEALAELTQRYFTGHGPATLRDFVWWSGLTLADAKAGIALAGADLAHEEIDGQTCWFAAETLPAVSESAPEAFLLPTYDEFLVGYSGFAAATTGGRPRTRTNEFSATVVFDGRVIGNWRRAITRGAIIVEIAPFDPLADRQREAILAAATRYGAFFGMPVECVWLYGV